MELLGGDWLEEVSYWGWAFEGLPSLPTLCILIKMLSSIVMHSHHQGESSSCALPCQDGLSI